MYYGHRWWVSFCEQGVPLHGIHGVRNRFTVTVTVTMSSVVCNLFRSFIIPTLIILYVDMSVVFGFHYKRNHLAQLQSDDLRKNVSPRNNAVSVLRTERDRGRDSDMTLRVSDPTKAPYLCASLARNSIG